MLKRLLAAVAAAFLLFTSPLPGLAISDYNRPELTRLWVSTENGDRFACTGTYIFPYISDYGSWIVSAGHCSIANLATRNQSETVRGVINWRGIINTHGEVGTGTIDIALGTVPDTRDAHPHIWLADKCIDTGRVYIHGFPEGVEKVNIGMVAPPGAEEDVTLLVTTNENGFPELHRKSLKELFPGLRFMMVKKGEIQGGSSGSPILGPDDRLNGILWGAIPWMRELDIKGIPGRWGEGDYDIVLFTPVERVHDLFKSIGVDG
jgi:hypothetical protein